jgi:hypothetical protein
MQVSGTSPVGIRKPRCAVRTGAGLLEREEAEGCCGSLPVTAKRKKATTTGKPQSVTGNTPDWAGTA